MDDANKSNRKPRRRRYWILALLLIIVTALGWFLPTIIAQTSLRDQVLNWIADAPQHEISSRAASFAWFSPLVINDLEINKSNDSVIIKIEKLTAEKSWFEMWLSSPNLGAMTVDRPQVNVLVKEDDEDDEEDDTSPELMPSFSATINNAHVVVRSSPDADPEFDVDNLELFVHLERNESRSFLEIGKLVILDDEELTPQQFENGLQLIAPELAGELNFTGKASVELTKTRLPFFASEDEFPKLIEVEGTLRIQQICVSIKNSTTQRLAMMLAEMLNLGDVPEKLHITKEALIQFQVHDGRLVHESLTIVLPDIAPNFSIASSGSVSLDEQIDLSIAVQLPQALLGDGPLAQKISRTPIELRISGTIDQPKTGLPAEPQWIIAISDDLLSPSLSEQDERLSKDIIQFIAELLKETDETPASFPAPLLQRIRHLNPNQKR